VALRRRIGRPASNAGCASRWWQWPTRSARCPLGLVTTAHGDDASSSRPAEPPARRSPGLQGALRRTAAVREAPPGSPGRHPGLEHGRAEEP